MIDEKSRQLHQFREKLDIINQSWTLNDYESLVKFFVRIIPKIMDAERCSIFIVDPDSETIWLKYGTGLKEREIEALREGTIVGEAVTQGKCILKNDLANRSGFHRALAKKTKFITRSMVCVPIKNQTNQKISGAIQVLNKNSPNMFTEEDSQMLQEIADYLRMAFENIFLNQEILKISGQLNSEIEQIWEQEEHFVAESKVMQNILKTVDIVSKSPVNVLINGESGTGKEAIAKMIHNRGERRNNALISVNCAAIPENLMESEFFGYEKGAFSGAVSSRRGLFEEAHGGSLLLDEIGEMPLTMQPKFLRAIQEGEGSRLGSNKIHRYDLRIISATNRDLRKEVESGHFRSDLFFRIFSVEIYIPPLRERREDIVPLAQLFLRKVSRRFQRQVAGYSHEVLNLFEQYHWPGNVRQLLNEVERLVALTPVGQPITIEHCSVELRAWQKNLSIQVRASDSALSLPDQIKRLEIKYIQEALKKTKGTKKNAAALLGITRQGLDKKLKRYNLSHLEYS